MLSLRVADLVAALGGRPRPLVAGALVSAAASDVGLLEGGVLLTRVTTRSAVSRSVNRVTTVARSVIEACEPLADLRLLRVDLVQYRRCCARHGGLQWFQVDRDDQSCSRLTPEREIFNNRMRRQASLAADPIRAASTKIS